MLTKQEIDNFKEIFKRKFAIDMSDKDALELGNNLIWAIKLVADPSIDKTVRKMQLVRYT